jgi:glycosyltransferase involved in cell wall biosynthesis
MQGKTGWKNSREKIKVSIIISAYNEEKNIKRVVKTVLESKLFAEIICVNDGSTKDLVTKSRLSLLKKIGVSLM